MSGQKYSGFLPGKHVIEGYGSYGFRFGGMSHRGSILALPSGIYAWDVTGPEELSAVALAQLFAEPRGAIEHLLIGTGEELRPLARDLREALHKAGIRAEPMASAAAARTYSVLLGENRRVAAALIAVA
jgi:uncharacterized protein